MFSIHSNSVDFTFLKQFILSSYSNVTGIVELIWADLSWAVLSLSSWGSLGLIPQLNTILQIDINTKHTTQARVSIVRDVCCNGVSKAPGRFLCRNTALCAEQSPRRLLLDSAERRPWSILKCTHTLLNSMKQTTPAIPTLSGEPHASKHAFLIYLLKKNKSLKHGARLDDWWWLETDFLNQARLRNHLLVLQHFLCLDLDIF